jgi:hypothetical protein
VFGVSPEYERWQNSRKCPGCGMKVMLRFALPDGTKVSMFNLIPLMDKRTILSCPKCGGSWPMFGTATPPATIETVRVMETSRVDEAIGQEVRRIDNSGPAGAVRRIKATRRWARRVEFSTEDTRTSNQGVDFALTSLIRFKADAETAVHRHFGIVEEVEQTFEEEVELSIPPRTVVEFVLEWKRIWQQGVAIGTDTSGAEIRLPFRAIVGLTFDQVTR